MFNLLLYLLLLLAPAPALSQNPTCPTRPTGDSSNACASTAFVQGAVVANTFILTGADPTGVNDSTPAFNTAIAASQADNCYNILIPPGTYKITGLTEGNGSNTQASSLCAPKLIGVGSDAPTFSYFPGYNQPTVTLKYAGTAGNPMLKLAGPLSGWGVQNVFFDCNSSAGNAILVVSSQFGRNQGIGAQNCTDYAFRETTITTNSTGLVDVNTLHNAWRDVSILIPPVLNAGGIWVGSGTTSDAFNTAYEDWMNVFISFNTTSLANFGLYLGATDSDVFRNFHFTAGGTGAACVDMDYNNDTSHIFPSGVMFDHFDTTGCAFPWEAAGPVSPFAAPNYVTNISEANGGTWPVGIANLYTMMGQNVGGADLGSRSGAITATQLARTQQITGESYRLSYYLVTTTTSGSATYNVEFFWNDGSVIQSFTSSNASCANNTPISGSVDVYSAATDAIQYQTNITGTFGGCLYHLVVNAQRTS